MGQKPDVGADLDGRGAERGERVDDERVGLTRVRLAGHNILLLEAGKLRHLKTLKLNAEIIKVQ